MTDNASSSYSDKTHSPELTEEQLSQYFDYFKSYKHLFLIPNTESLLSENDKITALALKSLCEAGRLQMERRGGINVYAKRKKSLEYLTLWCKSQMDLILNSYRKKGCQ